MGTVDTDELRELAGRLRAILAGIDAGTLGASTLLRARLEGAVVALEVAAGADAATVLTKLLALPDDTR